MVQMSERLRYLRDMHDLKQIDVAKIIDVSQSTYANYENGIAPKIENLIKLADFYNVTVDYLIGHSNDPRPSGNEAAQLFNKVAAANSSFPSTSDLLALAKATARYDRCGKPCTDLPLEALSQIITSLTDALNAASSGNFPALFDAANASANAALKIFTMPTLYLQRRYDEE